MGLGRCCMTFHMSICNQVSHFWDEQKSKSISDGDQATFFWTVAISCFIMLPTNATWLFKDTKGPSNLLKDVRCCMSPIIMGCLGKIRGSIKAGNDVDYIEWKAFQKWIGGLEPVVEGTADVDIGLELTWTDLIWLEPRNLIRRIRSHAPAEFIAVRGITTWVWAGSVTAHCAADHANQCSLSGGRLKLFGAAWILIAESSKICLDVPGLR